MKRWLIALCALALLPLVAAHEVYVLNSTTISSGLAVEGINVVESLRDSNNQFLFIAGTISTLALVLYLLHMTHTRLSRKLETMFHLVRPYAHLVIRIGLGIALAWGAVSGAIFGPEIPLESLPGGMIWKPILFVVGIMLVFGLWTRLAALTALVAWITVASSRGIYSLNYINYLGEIAVLLLERGTLYSLDEYYRWPSHIFHTKLPLWIEKLEKLGERYTFPIIRITFGLAVIYAAVSIKVLHPQLSLSVLNEFNLFTSFTALFVVFAAAIIEIAVGVLILLGILIRPVMIIFLFLMTYSIVLFGEAVWPHVILIALAIGLLLHGEDEWCLEDGLYAVLTQRTKTKK
jgi:uncharacterized membrane protein YphA (DoxX/SURF4 family)